MSAEQDALSALAGSADKQESMPEKNGRMHVHMHARREGLPMVNERSRSARERGDRVVLTRGWSSLSGV
jgi:hypothetical protein